MGARRAQDSRSCWFHVRWCGFQIEIVRIQFTYAALNGLDVFTADIRTAYLQAPSSKKDFIICGVEFGLENEGKVALIHRALYGGKKAGRNFRNHLKSCMRHLDFTSCLAYPDVWMITSNKINGTYYHEYILIYTDDALVVIQHAEEALRKDLGSYFELKQESIRPPKIYLRGHSKRVQLQNNVEAWDFSISQYVQTVMKNVEEYVKDKENLNVPSGAETPM